MTNRHEFDSLGTVDKLRSITNEALWPHEEDAIWNAAQELEDALARIKELENS